MHPVWIRGEFLSSIVHPFIDGIPGLVNVYITMENQKITIFRREINYFYGHFQVRKLLVITRG